MHYVQVFMILQYTIPLRIICMDTLNFTIEEIDGYIQQTTSTMIVESGYSSFSYSWTNDGIS